MTGRYFSLGPDAGPAADGYLRHYYGDPGPARADTAVTAGEVRDEVARLAGLGVTDLVLYPCTAALDQVARLADALAPAPVPVG